MTAWIVTGPTAIEEVETVVQWDGDVETFETVCDRLGDGYDYAQNGDLLDIWTADMGAIIKHVRPGQFVVRHHDNTVTVHDTDPRVEAEWEVCRKPIYIPSHTSNATRVTHRRPTYDLGNGWTITGPWTEVTG